MHISGKYYVEVTNPRAKDGESNSILVINYLTSGQPTLHKSLLLHKIRSIMCHVQENSLTCTTVYRKQTTSYADTCHFSLSTLLYAVDSKRLWSLQYSLFFCSQNHSASYWYYTISRFCPCRSIRFYFSMSLQ